MFKTTLLAILVMFVFTPEATKAAFYKYVDKKGNIVFTDDLSTIPENQRQNAERYSEPPPASEIETPAEENTPKSDSEKTLQALPASEEINLKKEELEKKQTELKQEYNTLMKEKEELERQKIEAKGREKIKAYNDHVMQFSEKLNKYNERRIALENEVSKYNETIEKLGNTPKE